MHRKRQHMNLISNIVVNGAFARAEQMHFFTRLSIGNQLERHQKEYIYSKWSTMLIVSLCKAFQVKSLHTLIIRLEQ